MLSGKPQRDACGAVKMQTKLINYFYFAFKVTFLYRQLQALVQLCQFSSSSVVVPHLQLVAEIAPCSVQVAFVTPLATAQRRSLPIIIVSQLNHTHIVSYNN